MSINLEDEEHYYWGGFEDGSSVLKDLVAERDALKVENEKLRAALRVAMDAVEYWASYASLYAHEKHDLAGDLQKLRAALGEKE